MAQKIAPTWQRSDGFGITQLEAIARGIPVITMPRCGKVITDGVDGRIIPAGDPSALAEAIAAMEADRPALRALSHAALEKSRRFQLPWQAGQIDEAVRAHRRKQIDFHVEAASRAWHTAPLTHSSSPSLTAQES